MASGAELSGDRLDDAAAQAVDWYAYGVIVNEMLTRRAPFAAAAAIRAARES